MTEKQMRDYNATRFRIEYGNSDMSQDVLTAMYLKKYGSITPLEALNADGCLRLASVICRLRKVGEPIDTYLVEDGKKRYARYVLRGDNE